MQVEKILNNNVVQSIDNHGQEVIVMGRGIGFGKRIGDKINPTKIEKTFVLFEDHEHFAHLYATLSPEEVDVVMALIDQAEQRFGQVFQENLYLTLADHLHFALERQAEGVPLVNPLAYEVQRFYHEEYQFGLDALEFIEERLGVRLEPAEATSIALHLINAQRNDAQMEQTLQVIQIIEDLINIVRIDLKLPLDQPSISYHRFVTHLQYFVQRVIEGVAQGSNDEFLYEQVQRNYPKAHQTAKKIKHYIEKKFDYEVKEDELVYLTIHIQRFIQ